MMGLYTARYGGLSVREAMYDYEKLAPVWARFHEDFMPDFQAEPIVPGRVFDLVGGKFVTWPGHGVGEDSPWQYIEAEYMKPGEYDALMPTRQPTFCASYCPASLRRSNRSPLWTRSRTSSRRSSFRIASSRSPTRPSRKRWRGWQRQLGRCLTTWMPWAA